MPALIPLSLLESFRSLAISSVFKSFILRHRLRYVCCDFLYVSMWHVSAHKVGLVALHVKILCFKTLILTKRLLMFPDDKVSSFVMSEEYHFSGA